MAGEQVLPNLQALAQFILGGFKGKLGGADPHTGNNWQDPNFREAQAVGRFSHTPIAIVPQNQAPSDFQGPNQDPVTGQYYITRGGGQGIEAYPSKTATYKDIQGVLAHEQIHAILNQLGGKYALPKGSPDTMGTRDGDPTLELPAYMGAYKPGELPGVTPGDADKWNANFLQGLPPQIAALLQRVIQSAKGVQASH